MHPFRFGVQYSSAATAADIRETARKVEDLGYSTIFCPDHFDDQWSPTIATTVAAEATSTLNVGTLVYDVDYRHPLVLAKEMASLDLACEGRLEFGLGAGWMATDYEMSGIPYDRPGIRIDRMLEAFDIVKGLWSDEPVTLQGEHYTITDAVGTPKPHRPGGPPVIIGGGGKRVLSEAAKRADIVGLNASLHSGSIGPEAVQSALGTRFLEKRQWVEDAAGDRFEQIELQLLTFLVMVTDGAQDLFESMAPGFGVSAEDAKTIPMVLVGTEDAICEQLHHHRETYGTSYIVIHDGEVEAMAPIVARLAGS
ncbi:MAG: putative F420-dependent oxidoreductase [Candidatus Poriferisodalaceae bacterium]|jgi:probable F420-dependent oxidoreductase